MRILHYTWQLWANYLMLAQTRAYLELEQWNATRAVFCQRIWRMLKIRECFVQSQISCGKVLRSQAMSEYAKYLRLKRQGALVIN